MLQYVACRWLGTRKSQRCETNGGDSQQSLPLVKLLLQKLVPLGLGDQPTEVHCGLYFFRAIRTHSTCTCCTRRRVTEKAWMAVLRWMLRLDVWTRLKPRWAYEKTHKNHTSNIVGAPETTTRIRNAYIENIRLMRNMHLNHKTFIRHRTIHKNDHRQES